MTDHSRFALVLRLAFLLALPLAFLRGDALTPSSPRPTTQSCEVGAAQRLPAALAPLALPLSPRRRSRSGMRAPSTRGRTWRPRLRPDRGRRVLAPVRRSQARGSRPQGTPPAPPSPPAESAPPASVPQVDRASALAIMRHYPAILRWVRRFGVPTRDAPDVAQAVVLAALPRWPTLPMLPGVSEATARSRWLFGVAAYHASDYRRAPVRREEPTDPAKMPDSTTHETPETAIVAREDAAEMGLETLRTSTTPERWTVFCAHDVEGLKMSAIAAIEGAPAATLYNRLRLARRDLRAGISRHRAQRTHSESRKGRE